MPAAFGGFAGFLPVRLGGDAETGLTSQQHARLAADQLAKKRTGPLAVLSWAAPGAADAAATLTVYRGMNGVGVAYGPVPGVVTADGIAFVWASQVFTDAYQMTEPFSPTHALVSFVSATFAQPSYQFVPGGIEIFAFDAAGAAINPQPAGTVAIW